MERNVSKFGFVTSMMECFPLCNNMEGQRALCLLTDDVVKASVLVAASGRTPLVFDKMLNAFDEDVDFVIVHLLFEHIVYSSQRDQFVLIFDAELAIEHFNYLNGIFTFIFCSLRFSIGQNLLGTVAKHDAIISKGDVNLGSYAYCHCVPIDVKVPSLFYPHFTFDKDGDWVSAECVAVCGNSLLVSAYSKSFSRVFLYAPGVSSSTPYVGGSAIAAKDFANFSSQQRERTVEVMISLSIKHFDEWLTTHGCDLDHWR